MLWTKNFWKGTAERAIKTFFQVFGAAISINAGAELIPALGVHEVDWKMIVSLATVSAILSVATSIGNADFTAGKEKL